MIFGALALASMYLDVRINFLSNLKRYWLYTFSLPGFPLVKIEPKNVLTLEDSCPSNAFHLLREAAAISQGDPL